MRKLIPKQYIESEFDKLIFTQAHQIKTHLSLTTSDITNIKLRFDNYQNHQSNLEYFENTSPSVYQSGSIYDSLFGLYDSTSQDTKKLKEEIQTISGVTCPYCGIDMPSHIDHFLPRSKFPEFSMHVPNLIYVCSICNSKYKGDDVVNLSGERKFFNPYFDNFIDSLQFLTCEILIDDSAYPTFKFDIDSSLITSYQYEYKIMKNHFDNMNLGTRYMKQISEEKFIRFKNKYLFVDVTIDKLKEDIEYELGGLIHLNDNNWEKVFLKSLQESDECLMLIVNKKTSIGMTPIN